MIIPNMILKNDVKNSCHSILLPMADDSAERISLNEFLNINFERPIFSLIYDIIKYLTGCDLYPEKIVQSPEIVIHE